MEQKHNIMEFANTEPSTSKKRSIEDEEFEGNIKRLKPYNEKSILGLDIGDNCHVSAQRFRSDEDVYIHIRYFDSSPTGKQYPSKKGIALPLDKFKMLIEDHLDNIDQALEGTKKDDGKVYYKQHLGQNIYVSVEQSYPWVDIRKWWLPENAKNVMPTKKGISLSMKMWEEFKKTIPELKRTLQSELDNVRYCYPDHDNQMAMLECKKL
jgi:hypothetical protein